MAQTNICTTDPVCDAQASKVTRPIQRTFKADRQCSTLIPKDVPVARRSDGKQFVWNTSERTAGYYADEAQKTVLGPMPVRDFLDEFLPATNRLRMPDARGAFNNVPRDPINSGDISAQLVSFQLFSRTAIDNMFTDWVH